MYILTFKSTGLERIGKVLEFCPGHLEQVYGSDLGGALLARKLPVMYLVFIYMSIIHVWAFIFMELECGELCRCMSLHFLLLTQRLLLLPEKLLLALSLLLKVTLKV